MAPAAVTPVGPGIVSRVIFPAAVALVVRPLGRVHGSVGAPPGVEIAVLLLRQRHLTLGRVHGLHLGHSHGHVVGMVTDRSRTAVALGILGDLIVIVDVGYTIEGKERVSEWSAS